MYLLPAAGRSADSVMLLSATDWLIAAEQRDAVALEGFLVLTLERAPNAAEALLLRLGNMATGAPQTAARVAAVRLLLAAGRPERAADAAVIAAAALEPGDARGLELAEARSDALAQSGRPREALAVLVDLRSTTSDQHSRRRLAERAGLLALDLGEHDIAKQLFGELVSASSADDAASLRYATGLAAAELALGNARSAQRRYAGIVRQARRAENFDVLTAALGGEAAGSRQLGQRRRALALHAEEEALLRRRGDRRRLARSLVNQSLSAVDADNFSRADDLLEAAHAEAKAVNDGHLAADIRRRQVEVLEPVGLGQGQRAATLREEIERGLAPPPSSG